MKYMFMAAALCFCFGTANAKDACSSQLKGYMAGLETSASLKSIDKSMRDAAMKKIDQIKELQETVPDCKIVELIPELKATRDALNHASKQIKQ